MKADDNEIKLHQVQIASDPNSDFQVINEKNLNVEFSYSVKHELSTEFEEDDHNDFTDNFEEEITYINYFPILSSFLLVFSLVVFTMILFRKVIKNDMQREDLEMQDTAGWKFIRSEVFLAPTNKLLLTLFTGTGIQFVLLFTNVLVLGILGIYYHHSENIKTIAIVIYCFTSCINGYYTASYYKYIGGKHWGINILSSAFFLPTIIFVIVSLMNFITLMHNSTSFIPFKTMFIVLFLWLIVYVPLTLIGGLTGRAKTVETLVNPDNSIPRVYKPVPKQPFYQAWYVQIFISGLPQFCTVYQVLTYVYQSTWEHKMFHFYGLILLIFSIIFIVVICIAISYTYFSLAHQNYNWWWQSYLNGGSLAFYVFGYSVYYYYASKMYGTLQVTTLI